MALVIPAGTRSVEAELPPVAINLERQLRINQQRYEILDSYYHGRHPHSFDSLRFTQAFGRQLGNFADNWMRLVINSTANRLRVQGFQIGGDTNDVLSADNDAWGIWQANDLDRASMIAHRETMKYGTAFLMVDPTKDPPTITVETPLQVIGQRSAANRFVLINAIKKWVGDDGYLYLNYFEPHAVFKYRSATPAQTVIPNDPARILQQASWIGLGAVENPLGAVPIVPFENQPDLMIGGISDLDDLIPLNDALNKMLRDMLVASEYQNFRQRYILGVENPKDPVTGRPLSQSQAQLVASVSQFMAFPPTAKDEHPIQVGEFGQVDLAPYITAIEMMVHHISMVSMTPAYMLVGKMANLSADAIRAAEARVRRKARRQADRLRRQP